MTLSAERNSPIIDIDGRQFHLAWLRYSCPCTRCRHPESFQKIADLSGNPELPEALSVDLDIAADELQVVWREEPTHVSNYPLRWLLLHGAGETRADDTVAPVVWDRATILDQRVRWHDVAECDTDGGPWFDDLQTYGFALISGVTPAEFERLLSGLAPVHYTEYGRQADVRAVPGAEDLAETESALTAHTDYPYKLTGPLIQFCYFKENKATGGEFFLVDGYQVANDFRSAHPRWFDLLVSTPVEFEQVYTSWRYLYRIRRPIITLDDEGSVAAIHLGHSHAWTWEIDPERCAEFYRAYHEFLRLLGAQRYRWEHRFADGECVAFNNTRILHGRNAFDPKGGVRHLITAYIPWQQLDSRVRFHKERHLYLNPSEHR
jgi:gamma-butyrobetaine dioxygenase